MTVAQPDETDSALHAALAYARRGWRVVPIIRGQKRPPFDAWQDKATTDEALIRRWWKGAAHGVGIATGTRSGIFVVDVDVRPGKDGNETLADLEAAYGPLPATREHLTGSGGRHLFFAIPPGVVITNDAGVRLGPGLDVRGEGGQVLAPPTIHPNGQPYAVDLGCPDDPAEPPGWLVALLTKAPDGAPRAERVPYTGEPRPGDRFAASVTWPELLTADGATYLGERTDRAGNRYELWSRPGVDDHAGASLYYGGTDVLKVFTSGWPGLDQDATYTRFGYWAARWHGGDHSAAARALSARQNDVDLASLIGVAPSRERGAEGHTEAAEAASTTWERVDLGSWLDGDPGEPATVLPRDDGTCLIYTGRINMLFGESTGGKSWVALHACAERMLSGAGAIYIDLEDHPRSIVARLRQLGVPREAIERHFVYVRPEIGGVAAATTAVGQLVAEHKAEIVVLDSLGEAMALFGVKDEDVPFSSFVQTILRPWSRTGAAVVVLDHVVKNQTADTPKLYSIGSQRKRAMVDGASYRVDVIERFTRTRSGRLKLTTAKDRLGNHVIGSTVAEVAVSVEHGRLALTLVVPPSSEGEDGEFRPTHLMERVSRFLEDQIDPVSGRVIEAGVTGKGAAKRQAISCLVNEGFVRLSGAGKTTAYEILTPYREPDIATASHRVPPRPTASRDAVPDRAPTASFASPPYRGDAKRDAVAGEGTRSYPQEDGDAVADPDDDPNCRIL